MTRSGTNFSDRAPRSSFGAIVLLLAVLATVSPVVAQDDETESHRGGRFLFEIDAWVAQPVGAQFEPATVVDPGSTLGDEIIAFAPETSSDPNYKFVFDAGKKVGAFRLTWYTQTQEQSMKQFRPGEFVYGQIQSHPLGAGYLNDGRADGFEAGTKAKISDFRFDFSRTAFRSDHMESKWFVGIRHVEYERNLDTMYYALNPLQPPLIPPVSLPRPDLDPLPDRALVSSKFRGRGLEAGMDFDVPLVKDRIKLSAGFAVAVLRGKTDTGYSSTNWVYVFTDPVSGEQSILAPPYDFTAQLPDPPPDGSTVADNTAQDPTVFRLSSENRSTTSPALDLYLELRGRLWKALEIVAGFRTLYYGDLGVELRPKLSAISNSGTNLVDVTETDRSVGYEGFYVGAAYTF